VILISKGWVILEQVEYLVMYNEHSSEMYEVYSSNSIDEVKKVIESFDRGSSVNLNDFKVVKVVNEIDVRELMRNNPALNWYAKGDVKNDSIIIYVNDVPITCILSEQVIHGLAHCDSNEIKYELRLTYSDILEDLGLE
jgi:hypothetical protein